MPSSAEVARALQGAARLARFDATGLAAFDRSLAGFWRSFFAAVIAAPPYFALIVLRMGDDQELGFHRLGVELGAYVVSWLAYPNAVAILTRLLDREEHYFDYMVPYNWAAVLQVFLLLAVAVLTEGGIVPAAIAGFVEFGAVVAIMVYQGFIARAGLLIGPAQAVAFVAIDLLLNLVIARLARALI
jgi:hypothetical protein